MLIIENLAIQTYTDADYLIKNDVCQKFYYDIYCVTYGRASTSTVELIQMCPE